MVFYEGVRGRGSLVDQFFGSSGLLGFGGGFWVVEGELLSDEGLGWDVFAGLALVSHFIMFLYEWKLISTEKHQYCGSQH